MLVFKQFLTFLNDCCPIRHLWQLKTVVFLHRCLICAVQLSRICWCYCAKCCHAECRSTKCRGAIWRAAKIRMTAPRTPYWSGWTNTVDLLVTTSSDQWLFMLKKIIFLFYKTSDLYEEGNCTEPFPSVRLPRRLCFVGHPRSKKSRVMDLLRGSSPFPRIHNLHNNFICSRTLLS